MAVPPLEFDDPRVARKSTQIRGKTYSYILGQADGPPKANVVLVHGFPDLAWGWRYQIPYLMSKGYNVVAPDMLGYGQTDAPEPLEEYSLKNMSHDLAALVAELWGPQARIVLGGHDWGGAFIWRFAMWHPEILIGIFSVCTPFNPPLLQYIDLAHVIAAGKLPFFGYQLQFRGLDLEKELDSEDKIRLFLNAMLAGRTPEGELAFSPTKGILLDKLARLRPSPLVPQEEVEVSARELARNGMRGPLNWYRTREINFRDELPLARRAADEGGFQFKVPAMMVTATKDIVLLPSLSEGMDRFFAAGLTRREVDSGHWATTVKPQEVNEHVSRWIEELLSGADVKSNL